MMDLITKPIRMSPEALQVELEECRRLLTKTYVLDRQKKVLENRIKEIEKELEDGRKRKD